MKPRILIPRALLVGLFVICLAVYWLPSPTWADDKKGSTFPTKPLFRPDSTIPGEEFEDAREIMDEVIKNRNGKDDFLSRDKWQRIEAKAADGVKMASQVGKPDGHEIFMRIYRGLNDSLTEAYQRRTNIHFLKAHISKTLKEKEARFQYLLGREPLFDEFLKKHGFGEVSTEIAKIIREFVNGCLKVGRRLTGPASIILDLYDALVKSGEHGEMKVLIRQMLELTEMEAYLARLLKQYDELSERLTNAVVQMDEAYKAHGPVEHKSTSPKVPIYLQASGRQYFCPENYYLSGLYYSDIGGGPDKRVTKLECTRLDAPGYILRKTYRGTTDVLTMNGLGTNWYYLKQGYLINGAYYSNRDYSIENFLYIDPNIYRGKNRCTVRFRYQYTIQMRGNGSNWYTCRQGFYITGAYYKDDDEKGNDDSVEAIQCSKIVVECR